MFLWICISSSSQIILGADLPLSILVIMNSLLEFHFTQKPPIVCAFLHLVAIVIGTIVIDNEISCIVYRLVNNSTTLKGFT